MRIETDRNATEARKWRADVTLPTRSGIALVTGAGSGIGRSLTLALGAAGCHVILVGRQENALRSVAEGLSGASDVIVADLANQEGLETVARACPATLDVLVHSAGVFHQGSPADLTQEALAALHAVNTRAPMILTEACLPALKSATGQIVMINSTAGLVAGAGNSAYAASKHALKLATEGLRQDLKGAGVRVVSIFPGRTATAMQRQVLEAEKRADEPIPLLQPEDIASAVMYSLRMPRRAEVTDIVIRPRNAA